MAVRLRDALGADADLHIDRRFAAGLDDVTPFDLPVRPLVVRLFAERRRLALVMPVGAAVRLLAPLIGDKRTDPAVVCIDDAGRFAISLLSGHIGGADIFAAQIAAAIDATPVVTSAAHALGTLAVDLLGSEFGWQIEACKADITRASAAVINGEPVGVFQDAGERNWRDAHGWELAPNIHICEAADALAAFPTALMITDRADAASVIGASDGRTLMIYRPGSLIVGVGCRRGVSADEVDALLRDTLTAHNLSAASVRCVATAELKRDEPALQLLAERLGVPMRCYDAAALNAAPIPSGPSASLRLLGIAGVCEPAALLAAADEGGGVLVVPKVKSAAATLAIARLAFS